jgi:hypothetical protein
MARKKIHKVVLDGKDYFVNAETKLGAVRDTLDHLRMTATVDVASGLDLFYLGTLGGEIIGVVEPANLLQDQNQQVMFADSEK